MILFSRLRMCFDLVCARLLVFLHVFFPEFLVLFCICSGIVKNWSKTKLGTWWGLDIIDRHAKMYWDGFQDLPSKTAQKAWVLYGLTRPFSRYDKTFKRPKRIEQRFPGVFWLRYGMTWNLYGINPWKNKTWALPRRTASAKSLSFVPPMLLNFWSKQIALVSRIQKTLPPTPTVALVFQKRFGSDSLTEEKLSLLTLARAPWVSESCKNFYASVGRLITQLKVPIIYAQEGIQVGYRLTWEETWRNQNKLLSSQSFYRFFTVSSILSGVHGCTGTVHYCTVCIFGPDLRSLWFVIFMHLVTRLCLCRSTVVQKKVGNVKMP